MEALITHQHITHDSACFLFDQCSPMSNMALCYWVVTLHSIVHHAGGRGADSEGVSDSTQSHSIQSRRAHLVDTDAGLPLLGGSLASNALKLCCGDCPASLHRDAHALDIEHAALVIADDAHICRNIFGGLCACCRLGSACLRRATRCRRSGGRRRRPPVHLLLRQAEHFSVTVVVLQPVLPCRDSRDICWEALGSSMGMGQPRVRYVSLLLP